MDTLGPVPGTLEGNQDVLVMTDRYSKLTKAVPTSKTTASHIVSLSMDNRIMQSDIKTHVLAGNRTQFVGKFFKSLCAFSGTKHLTIPAHHPQTNGQTERLNKTIIVTLQQHVAEHQRDWDIRVHPLTYA